MSFGCFDVRVKLYSETPKLSASMAAQKSLERMFSGLGKEKEIEAGELTRKVHELKDTKEFLNDDKAHNNMLLAKVQACAARNKIATLLSKNLLRSLDGYRFLTKKLKES
ncbi:PREDICTED: uncharacterized protein LOC109115821 [Nelumbo nucifera]|uniref:Uncharacterized protein LOC109115821 n=1 Tax=Nelumbo nucifera TaxID=4432 RepID=A0A1U8QAF8_NELNU|nr:PREDICTED: uncharacterized protein LOC109115821 [Nelumbo nucifera]